MKGAPYPPLPEKLADFRVFLILVWRTLGLPDPTPVQLDIAGWLQRGERRKVIEAFRGAGKSWITSAYVMWKLRLNKDLKFLVVSAGRERADNFTAFCMRLMSRVDVLKCMLPGRTGRGSRTSFDTAGAVPDHAPSVKSVGIFGQITGTRADEIIADDVETPANSLTQAARDRLSEAVKEFDAVIKPGGSITYLGTPQTEQSLYGLLPARGYSVRIWPARYPGADEAESLGTALAPGILNKLKKEPFLAGKPTDPARFSQEDLSERELSYGRAGFALQFMLNTALSDAERYPLKLSDLIVAELSGDNAPERITWEKSGRTRLTLPSVGFGDDSFYYAGEMSGPPVAYRQRVMAVDPAGRGKDETAYAVLYERDGYLFLMEAGGLEGGYSAGSLETLAYAAKAHSVNAVIIESNFGDGMFAELFSPVLLRAGVKAKTEEVRHLTMKEARLIDTLEPVISGHRLVVEKSVIEKDFSAACRHGADSRHRYMLFYQMTHIMKERGALAHDDRLDALAMGVAYFSESMRQDAEDKARKRGQRILEKEMASFCGAIPRRSREELESAGMMPAVRIVLEGGACRSRGAYSPDIRDRLIRR